MAADNAKNGATGPARLSVEAILSKDDTPKQEVYVKDWDGTVLVRGLTKRQQVDIRNRSLRANDKGGEEADPEFAQRYMWLEGVIEPVFTEEQLGPLFEKNAGAVDTVLNAIMKLSGMDAEAIRAREAMFRKGPGGAV